MKSSGKKAGLARSNCKDRTFFDSQLFLALNSSIRGPWITAIRAGFALTAFAVLTLYTFGLQVPNDLVLGGAAAMVGTQLWASASARFVFNEQYQSRRKGEPGMVTWLSFWLFMDCVYYFLHPNKSSDARTGHEGKIEDERTDATLEPDGSFLFDFVADTGDGFNSCYSVATTMAKKLLEVEEVDAQAGTRQKTQLARAKVVIHGGDIVYPFPTERTFESRFISPYSTAFPEEAGCGEKLYYVVGNHEYMDGLVAFRNHLLPRSQVGGWETPQTTHYFALKLPHNWWLFGIDLGPEPEDIDEAQAKFFETVPVADHERIILVYHVPDWIKVGRMGFIDYRRLGELRTLLGDKVRLILAGDLHNYRRMEKVGDHSPCSSAYTSEGDADGAGNCYRTCNQTLIVAGHGGAFLHATHAPIVTEFVDVDGVLTRNMCVYPTVQESKEIWDSKWLTMFFTTTNGTYMRLLGGIYLLMFFASGPGQTSVYNLLTDSFTSGFFVVSFSWFIVTHHILATASQAVHCKMLKVACLVLSHTFAHVLTAAHARVAFDQYVYPFLIAQGFLSQDLFVFSMSAGVFMFIVGSLLAPLVTGTYFHVTLNVFDWHWNEAIATVQHQDHKGFCRIRINPNGDLDIYTIGIDKVPRTWEEREPTPNNPSLKGARSLSHRLVERVTVTFSQS